MSSPGRTWLAHYPFTTRLPYSTSLLEELISNTHPLHVLARRLDRFESALRQATNQDIFQLALCIQWETGAHVVDFTQTQPPRLADFENLALVVASYRVLDVYLAQTNSFLLSKPSPRNADDLTVPKHYHFIKDWVKLVTSFSTSMQAAASDTCETSDSNQGLLQDEWFVAILKNRISEAAKSSISQISSNMSALSKGEKGALKKMVGSDSSFKALQLCLEGSFLCTPLHVIESANMSRRGWARERMLKVAHAMGNDKPGELVSVEGLLFRGLFQLAFDRKPCSEVLLSLASLASIPNLNLKRVPSDRRTWFQLGVETGEPPRKRRKLVLSPSPASSRNPSPAPSALANAPSAKATAQFQIKGDASPQGLVRKRPRKKRRRKESSDEESSDEDSSDGDSSDEDSSDEDSSDEDSSSGEGGNDEGGEGGEDGKGDEDGGGGEDGEGDGDPFGGDNPDGGIGEREVDKEMDSGNSLGEKRGVGELEGGGRGMDEEEKKEDGNEDKDEGDVNEEEKKEDMNEEDGEGDGSEGEGDGEGDGNEDEEVGEGDGNEDEEEGEGDGNEDEEEGEGDGNEDEEEEEERNADYTSSGRPFSSKELMEIFEIGTAPYYMSECSPSYFVSSDRLVHGVKRIVGKEYIFYDIDGRVIFYVPEMHTQEDLDKFQLFYDAIQASYIDGKPRYLHECANTGFRRVPQSRMDSAVDSADWADLRREFSCTNFVVRDSKVEHDTHSPVDSQQSKSPEFTLKTLHMLAPIDQPLELHDYTFTALAGRHRTGTLRQVHCEHMKGKKGKIINVLDLPAVGADVSPGPLFSDVAAHRETKYCPLPIKTPYPIQDMRWGLAATKDASHYLHMDSDGLCTFLRVLCGRKLWVVATPPDGSPSRIIVDLSRFLDNWDPSCPTGSWLLEAIVLCPGDVLYMKAGTLHAVWTLESSACIGGHFLCSSSFTDTASALIHGFHMDLDITNASHANAVHHLLSLQVIHYHSMLVCDRVAPCDVGSLGIDLQDFYQWHGFVLLHVLVVLRRAIDIANYKREGISTIQTSLMEAHARGAALGTMTFLKESGLVSVCLPGLTNEQPQHDPLSYFEDVLLNQAILLMRAQDAFSDFEGPAARFRDRLKGLLHDAMSHAPHLQLRFKAALRQKMKSSPLPAVPYSEAGSICFSEEPIQPVSHDGVYDALQLVQLDDHKPLKNTPTPYLQTLTTLESPRKFSPNVFPAMPRHHRTPSAPSSIRNARTQVLRNHPPHDLYQFVPKPGELLLVYRMLTIIREACQNVKGGLVEIASEFNENLRHIQYWCTCLSSLETGTDGLQIRAIRHVVTTTLISLATIDPSFVLEGRALYAGVAGCWSFLDAESQSVPVIPDLTYSPGCTTTRLMEICLQHRGAYEELSEEVNNYPLYRLHFFGAASLRLQAIPTTIKHRRQIAATIYDINVILQLFTVVYPVKLKWSYFIKEKVVFFLFAALSHLATLPSINTNELVTVASMSHRAIQWLMSSPVAITTTLRHAIEGGVLTVVSCIIGGVGAGPINPEYLFALDDYLVLACHTSYRPILRAMDKAVKTLWQVLPDARSVAVRRWLELALVAGKRCIAAMDKGLLSTCDNITHGELRRGKKCRKGAVRTCSMCHTAVYCSVKCQRADWETLHRDECTRNLEDYQHSKVAGTHLSYDSRLHHRTLIEDMAKRYTPYYPLAFGESDAVPLLKIDSLQRIGFFDEFNPAKQELDDIPRHFINRQNAYVDSLRLERQATAQMNQMNTVFRSDVKICRCSKCLQKEPDGCPVTSATFIRHRQEDAITEDLDTEYPIHQDSHFAGAMLTHCIKASPAPVVPIRPFQPINSPPEPHSRPHNQTQDIDIAQGIRSIHEDLHALSRDLQRPFDLVFQHSQAECEGEGVSQSSQTRSQANIDLDSLPLVHRHPQNMLFLQQQASLKILLNRVEAIASLEESAGESECVALRTYIMQKLSTMHGWKTDVWERQQQQQHLPFSIHPPIVDTSQYQSN
ncbi:hypothetical protein D9611_014649 [Ephemerocybe angulata]|uniref:Uncharacterized protein n=1 Tax=Ephemerocybe angulata TaxID=980116 RepID=A0A8H5CB42_9AGAR|nr:hypothetical protein D9611_014649 [Tulosesus angulatus]